MDVLKELKNFNMTLKLLQVRSRLQENTHTQINTQTQTDQHL